MFGNGCYDIIILLTLNCLYTQYNKIVTGRILLQRTLPRPLLISDTFASLSKDLAIIGAQSIMFCVENLKQLLPPHSSVDTQTTAESSHVFPMARKIRPEQQYVNFEKQTAIEVYSEHWAYGCIFSIIFI